MSEWVLILTMHIMGQPNTMPDVQFQTIDGFTSKSTCIKAGEALSYQLMIQTSKHREQQNIIKNGAQNFPSVFSECVQISK